MPQQSYTSYEQWIGQTVYDKDGDKIGEIDHILYDDRTGRPEWLAVKTGLFGTKTTLMPIQGLSYANDRLTSTYTKDEVKDAPRAEDEFDITAAEEQSLFKHYEFDWNDTSGTFGYPRSRGTTERLDADYQVQRGEAFRQQGVQSERGEVVAEETVRNEQAAVTPTDRTVRLRKYQWTEQVPVQREEVRMEETGGTATEATKPPTQRNR